MSAQRFRNWIAFGIGLGLVAITAIFLQYDNRTFPVLALVIGAVFLYWFSQSLSASSDLMILLLAWFWFVQPDFFAYLFLNAAVLLTVSHAAQSRLLLGLSALAVGAFFFYNQPFAFSQFTIIHWLVTGCTLVSFVIEALALLGHSPQKISSIDAILCSYSGNTAHYSQHFHHGLSESGAKVRVHRFEHHKTFDADLHGDALAIMFPVFGWKMPWPLLGYLLLRLPPGSGKPAYIVYTAGGGPENAGFVAWVLLTFKGYRVLGKVWSIYPFNVATLRIGPKHFWKWFDRLLPFQFEEQCAQRAGQAFANGRSAGMPILLWPFPLFVIGILIENPIVNRIYHHYVWKRRCTRCGLCIRHCPSGRLYKSDDGYPRAKGECILCLRCINICPTNAMHVLGFSEYGAPYPPKWPDLALPKSPDVKRDS